MITAGMFLTGMAANPLLAQAASDVLKIEFGWTTWALGAIVPGLTSLLLMPLVVYRAAKPELKHTRDAQQEVRKQYRDLGPWTRREKWMAMVFVSMIALWTTGTWHGMDTTLVAWIGVCILLLTDTLTWDRMIRNFGAWDALVWLGGLLTLANLLRDYGFVEWFSTSVSGILPAVNPLLIMMILALIYFFSMYLFSQLTAHIAAFIGGYFALAMAYSIPPFTMAALFAGFSTLCGCLTPYASGPCIIYFGQGYVPLTRWFRVGFLVGLLHIAVWFTIGMGWWKLLGWW